MIGWYLFGICVAVLIGYLLWVAITTPFVHARNDANWFLRNPPKEKMIPVVCIGDSITHGIVSGNYVDRLQNRFKAENYVFINAGINSQFVWNINQRLDAIIRCQPRFITILIGTNDANRSTDLKNQKFGQRSQKLPQLPTLEFFQENYRALVNRLKSETNAKIALLSLPTIGEDKSAPIYEHVAKFNAFIKQLAADTHVTYLPLHETMQTYLDTKPPQKTPPFTKRQLLIIKGIIFHLILRISYQKIADHHHFYLHTDHLHLNDQGAEIVENLIESFIKSSD